MTDRQITVLGAGIVGVCCALSLQEQGFKVTLVDRAPAGEATSYGNAGVISPWSCVPMCMPGTAKQIPGWLLDREGPVTFRWQDLPQTIPWVLKFLANTRIGNVERISDSMSALMRDNVGAYRRYLSGTGESDLILDSVHVNAFRGDVKPSLNDLPWTLRERRGASLEIVDSGALREIEPALSEEFHSAVIIRDQGRAVAPGRLCKVLFERAVAGGMTFTKANVRSLKTEPGGGVTLICDDSSIESDTLVLAAGVWSAELLDTIGIRVPLISERGYHVEFADPGIGVNHSVLDVAGKFIASSMEGGVRAAGTSEFAHFDAPARFERADLLRQQTERMFPGLNTREMRQWMGVRPSFPDNLPAIGKVPGHENIIAAFGHSHWGLGMAPGTGRMVCNILNDVGNQDEQAGVSLARFR